MTRLLFTVHAALVVASLIIGVITLACDTVASVPRQVRVVASLASQDLHGAPCTTDTDCSRKLTSLSVNR